MSFAALEQISNVLVSEYPESKAWNDSPFRWIRLLPPGSKHVVGRDMLTALIDFHGLTPTLYRGQVRVNGNGISVKVAMMWEEGIMKFQNIRDTEFDFVFCLALYPHKAYGWVIPKIEVWEDQAVKTRNAGITSQHKGADAWIHIDPNNVQGWLQPFGGTIDQAMEVLKKSV
jgi:hypothetical protein